MSTRFPEKLSGLFSSRTRMLTGIGVFAGVIFLAAFIPFMLIDSQDDSHITLRLDLPTCVRPGDASRVPIVLSRAPAGLSGYLIRMDFADDSVAEVEGVAFPDFGMDSENTSFDLPIRIAAVDIKRRAEAGDKNIRLATLTIRGLIQGETGVDLRVIQMDDDAGDVLNPEVASQVVNVCRF